MQCAEPIWQLRPDQILSISDVKLAFSYDIFVVVFVNVKLSSMAFDSGLACIVIITKFSEFVIFTTISYSKGPISAVIWIQKYIWK